MMIKHCFSKILLVGFLFKIASCGETLELICSSDDDCSSYADKQVTSFCLHQNCNCFFVKTNKYTNCASRQPILSNKIGDNCPCDVPNSHCVFASTKCECDTGFVETPDKLRCIQQVVQLSQSCEMNEQCVKFDRNAVCHEATCRCLKNFALHDNNCRSVVKVYERCESDVQCRNSTSNVSCIDHICACDKNFVSSKNGNDCLPYAFYNETCKENSQCENGLGPGSLCDNGLCVCDDVHREIKDNDKIICQRDVKYGDECQEHNDCSLYLNKPTMMCSHNRCVCRDGHELYDAYAKKCVETLKSSATTQVPSIIGILIALKALVFLDFYFVKFGKLTFFVL